MENRVCSDQSSLQEISDLVEELKSYNFCTIAEYKDKVSSGELVNKPTMTDDLAFATNNPGHPLSGDFRFDRIRCGDEILRKVRETDNEISSEILAGMHEVLFDCCATVRLSIAEALGLIHSKNSIFYLKKLLETEVESKMVIRSTVKALRACGDTDPGINDYVPAFKEIKELVKELKSYKFYTVEEYNQKIESGEMSTKPTDADDFQFAIQNPDHPLLMMNRLNRMRCGDQILDKIKELDLMVPDETLESLHEILFDCCPAIRLSIAEALIIIQNKKSIPYFEKLALTETESPKVKKYAEMGCQVCDMEERFWQL
ncbi:MAG: hypothetical protein PWP56_1160 [Acetobacterium sp.]|nr:hypothetical protein [Acetobacterium sp.]